MDLQTAETIWHACYSPDTISDCSGWLRYSSRERAEAIRVRQAAYDREHGAWGFWQVGDRD